MNEHRQLDNGNIRLTFRRTERDTAGAFLEMEAVYRAGSLRPPAHFHPAQEELFEIVEGSLRFNVGGEERTVKAGERLVIPARTVHQAWNDSAGETRAVWTVRPALRTQRMFETLYGLAMDGKTNAAGTPNLLQTVMVAREYRNEFVVATPPVFVQNCVFGILAPIASLLGYRAHYDQYSIGE